jgi:hypothetical protein
MITTELRQIFISELTKLPEYQRLAMGKFDWISELEKIAIKHSFIGDQERIFVSECAMVLLELSDPTQLVPELVGQLGVPEATIAKALPDVYERVFMRIEKEIALLLGDTAPVMQKQLEQEFAEQNQLAETGLVITDEPVTGSIVPSSLKSVAPITSEPMRYGQSPALPTNPTTLNSGQVASQGDPYHEPVE